MVKSAGVYYMGLYVSGTRGFHAPSRSCVLPMNTGPSVLPSLTYLPTPWSRVLLEKLIVNFAASQEIPRIYGTRNSSPYPQVSATCPYPEPISFTAA
jgi:hypothetical protein